MTVGITVSGSFDGIKKSLKNSMDLQTDFAEYGRRGVEALRLATPKDSGLTADSWVFNVAKTHNGVKITWSNLNIVDGVNIAVLIQYGHGTKEGVYVQGRDYINPAMRDIFDSISTDIWRKVSNAR